MGLHQVRKLKGRVSFVGNAADGQRVCLWSRLASRVFAVIARFDCPDADALYASTRSVDWQTILKPGASIAVAARGSNDELRNSHFAALRVKDAICDQLIETTGTRPIVDTEDPGARIALSLRGERASLHFDLSGEPLFKRLPREAARPGAAHILRPDYAALMLAQGKWSAACEASRTGTGDAPLLIDASCAGGGIELEAVNILLDRAPGLLRNRWGFEGWARYDVQAWHELLEEADKRAEAAADTAEQATILATDVSGSAAEFARRIVKRSGFARYATVIPAGVGGVLDALDRAGVSRVSVNTNVGVGEGASVNTNESTSTDNKPQASSRGIIIADTTETAFNQTPAMLSFVSDLRTVEELADLPVVALTRDDMLPRSLGSKPVSILAVKPNNEDAHIVTFAPAADVANSQADTPNNSNGPSASAGATNNAASDDGASAIDRPFSPTYIDLGDGSPLSVLIPESEQFAHRLRKVARLRRKWAQREGITCYRVYDADLPDYSAAIDLYEGSAATPGRWLVIAEYAAPKSIDPALAQARLLDILAIAPRILNVDPDSVYAKARIRSRGGSQYGKRKVTERSADEASEQGSFLTRKLPLIEEGGLTFAVSFNDYLDTGIFLDHRITRDLVREHARGKRFFCNLFAYAGTATCYAADAGVEETVTVDLSNTYLDWAERNMRQNGFTGPEHHYVRADVMRWISDMRQTRNRWDLIFCDPPTFSNSSKMGRRTWDVQRDHAELIIGMSRLLTRDGEAIFSCNLRTCKPDIEKMARAGVVLTDITAQTIPEDFARNQRIHHCYIVRRYTPEEAMRLAGLA